MSILTDQIAANVAALVPLVAFPSGDLGFGSDMSCTDDITADAAELDGSDPLVVAQANYRRLTTPRGALPDDADYGFDVRGFCGKPLTKKALTEIPGQVRAELQKDDRNLDASIVVTVTPTGGIANGDFDLEVKGETALGPYTLTLAVTDADVLVKEIRGNGSVV